MKKTLTVGFAVLALSIGSAAVVAARTHIASLDAGIASVSGAEQANQGGDQGQTGELARAHQDGLQGQNGEADSPAAAAPTE